MVIFNNSFDRGSGSVPSGRGQSQILENVVFSPRELKIFIVFCLFPALFSSQKSSNLGIPMTLRHICIQHKSLSIRCDQASWRGKKTGVGRCLTIFVSVFNPESVLQIAFCRWVTWKTFVCFGNTWMIRRAQESNL